MQIPELVLIDREAQSTDTTSSSILFPTDKFHNHAFERQGSFQAEIKLDVSCQRDINLLLLELTDDVAGDIELNLDDHEIESSQGCERTWDFSEQEKMEGNNFQTICVLQTCLMRACFFLISEHVSEVGKGVLN